MAGTVKNVPDRFAHVRIDCVTNVHSLKGWISAAELITVAHVNGDVLKQDGTIEEAKKSAVDAGYYPGAISVSSIAVVACERDDKETATEFAKHLPELRTIQNTAKLQVCILSFCFVCFFVYCVVFLEHVIDWFSTMIVVCDCLPCIE